MTSRTKNEKSRESRDGQILNPKGLSTSHDFSYRIQSFDWKEIIRDNLYGLKEHTALFKIMNIYA